MQNNKLILILQRQQGTLKQNIYISKAYKLYSAGNGKIAKDIDYASCGNVLPGEHRPKQLYRS